MRTFGWWVFVAGVLGALYALLGLDPSVATSTGERVVNLDLLQTRQNVLIAGCAAAVVGLLMALLSSPGSTKSNPQFGAALAAGDLVTMQSLIDSGVVDPNGVVSAGGRSWLREAVALGAVEPVRLLLRAGADPMLKGNHGDTVLDGLKQNVDFFPVNRVLIDLCEDKELRSAGARMRSKRKATIHTDTTVVASEAAAQTPTLAPSMDIVSKLDALIKLRADGHLSDDEFVAAKAQLLALKNA